MAEKINLDIFINADKANLTLGELEDGLEAANEELRKLPRGSEEFNNLAKEITHANREIKNMELSMEALDNEQVASELGSVAGAIGDVTASFILLGGEGNETMEEIGKNIETAMGISMGLKGAIEGISSAQKLWTNVVKNSTIVTKAWTVAQRVLNVVLKANPIGLIITAITALVAGVIFLKDELYNLAKTLIDWVRPAFDWYAKMLRNMGLIEGELESERQAREKAEAERREKSIKDIRSSTKKYLNILEKAKEKEKQITDEKVKALDVEMRKRKANGEDTSKLEKEKLQVLVDSAKMQVEIEQRKVDALQKSIKKELELRGFTMEQAKAFAKENEAILKQAGFSKNIIDAVYGTSEELEASKENLENMMLDLEVFNIEQGRKAREQRQKEIDARKEIDKIQIIAAKELADEETKVQENKYAVWGQLAQMQADKEAELEKERQEQFDREQARRDKAIAHAQNGLDLLGAASDLFIKDEAKREKVKKKLALAQIAIDTAQAISGGIRAAAGIQFPGNLIAFIPTLTTILANMAKAKALLGSSASGVGGGGDLGSAASGAGIGGNAVRINPVSNTSTMLGDQQVVVAEGDITNVQNKVMVAEGQATF